MRIFIVLGHRVTTTPNFTLNDLPGSAGRLDILCRCVNSSFFLSHDIRRDSELYLILQNKITLRFVGSRLRHLNPDERSTAALIQRALKLQERLEEGELESTPGIFVSRRGLREVLDEAKDKVERLILLYAEGELLREAELTLNVGFILSDHLDFLPEELELLKDLPRLSLGPKVLHADHCIIIVHNELDLRSSPGPCYNGA
jgi:tRNA (pseudouridine54-N1)-methyltransferase